MTSLRCVLLGFVFANLCSLVLAQEAPPELVKLKTSYEGKIDSETAALRKEFTDTLLDLEKRLGEKRELEAALLVREFRVNRVLNDASDRKWMTSLPTEPEGLERAAANYKRRFNLQVSRWDAIYRRELSTLESTLVRASRLEAAVFVKKELEELEARMGRDDLEGDDKPEDLSTMLPGKIYSYLNGVTAPREWHFLEDGKVYDYARKLYYKWRARGRKVVVSHKNFTDDIVLTFAEDGRSFTGEKTDRGTERSGSYVATRKFREER